MMNIQTVPQPKVKAKANDALQVVVAIDFSDASGYALDQAATIARRVPRSRLHVIHVDENDNDSRDRVKQLVGQIRLYVEEKLLAVGSRIGSSMNGQMLGVHVRKGDAQRELAQFANDVHADLVVLGAHKANLRHPFQGQLAHSLRRSLDVPVLVATAKPPLEPGEVEPTIEPPCPQCVDRRFETSGQKWWCTRHDERHVHGRVYSYQREFPFAVHDSEVTPTGV
jgi:nucleotide-binding universal stress UspA family protein